MSWLRCSTSAMNLSKKFVRLLGGRGDDRAKFAEVQLRPLLEEGYTHLVINVPSSEDKVTGRKALEVDIANNVLARP